MSKKQRQRRPTIATKLSRTILMLAIPIFLVALGIFYGHANQMIQKEAIDRSSTILDNAVLRVERYISMVQTAAKSNLWMLEENFTPDSLQSISRRIVCLNADVLSCSVSTEPNTFPEIGRYFSVYSVDEGDTVITMLEPDFEYFDRVWYRTAMQSGKPCWVEPFSDFNTGTINYNDAVASFCIPIRPKGGKIAGVVSTDFSFRELARTVIENDHPYPNSYYILIGGDGRYLIHPNTNLLFKKTIFSNTNPSDTPDIIALGHEMTAGKKGITHIQKDDKTWQVCYAPVPETSWSLALISPEEEVLQDYHHLTIVLAIVVIIGLILIRWITSIVVRKNISPINQLLEATKRIADGSYDEIIPISPKKDIVSTLQNAFREMQLAIISETKATKEMTAELEKETAELEQILPIAQEASRRKQVFIQKVSSRISKPLNVICGLADVLQDSIASGSKNKNGRNLQQAEEISNIANTMKHNVSLLYSKVLMLSDSSESALADTSRYQRNELVACNELANDCINIIDKRSPGTRVQLESEVPDTLKVKTNKLYLQRTVTELLFNSAKHTDGKYIMLRITQTETHVRFVVEDKGPGLPKDNRELFFVPFTKEDDSTEGLGLGLPLCKTHSANLGGNLILDENYLDGCRFILEIPKM